MSSGKWRLFCLGLNVLSHGYEVAGGHDVGAIPFREELYAARMQEQREELEQLMAERHKLVAIQDQLQQLYQQLPGNASGPHWRGKVGVIVLLRVFPLSLDYCKTSNIRHTKFQNLNAFRLILQLSLSNPLTPGVK